MVEKRISIYGELAAQSPFNNDQLVFEVSNTHIVLMVKLAGKQIVNAFELFEFDKNKMDWYDIFYQMRTRSKILSRSFNDTKVYYNLSEALVMPANKFSVEAANTYLEAIHGDNTNTVVRYDNVAVEASLINVYRIEKPLFDMVNSNLMMVNTRHTYTRLLEDLFSGESISAGTYLNLKFYYGLLVVSVISAGKLQLIQTYSFQTAEDVLYYLLNIVQQLKLPTTATRVDVSGMVDIKSQEMEYIRKIFTNISVEANLIDAEFKNLSNGYPLHYFTPFLNLTA